MSSKECLASTNASSELPFNTGFEPGCTEQGYILITRCTVSELTKRRLIFIRIVFKLLLGARCK